MSPQNGIVSPLAFPLSYFFQCIEQCAEEGPFSPLPDSPVGQHRLEKGGRTPFWHRIQFGVRVHPGNLRRVCDQINNYFLGWRDRCWFLHGCQKGLYASYPSWMKVPGCAWQAGYPHSSKNLLWGWKDLILKKSLSRGSCKEQTYCNFSPSRVASMWSSLWISCPVWKLSVPLPFVLHSKGKWVKTLPSNWDSG